MIPKLLPKQTAESGYRRDIDGLRAIAVLSVVAFHFSKEVMPGGFLGVDVFFVLSGYLITGIIVREASAGRFSIARFYERRVRRIAPALLFVLTITTAIASLLLLPLDLTGFGKSLIASLGFVANIYFWRDGNYFGQSAETKPLLHIWSLGVEEQFYIFFPLLVILLIRWRGALFAAIVAAVLASLALNIWLLRSGFASPAFYLLPARAWELGAGAILVFLGTPRISRRLSEGAMLVAYVMLVAAIFAAPNWVPHPLPVALPAVIGTTLLLWLGSSDARPRMSWVLQTPPLVAIGLVSYSLYLWHWPLIVFANYYLVEGYGIGVIAGLLVAMFSLAWASWRFVERPFRQREFPIRKLYLITGCWALALAVSGAGLVASKGMPDRLPSEVASINAAIGSHYRCPITLTTSYDGVRTCWFDEGDPSTADILLLGNSHAQMYAPLLREKAELRGLRLLMIPANGCAPLMGVNIRAGCIAIAERNIEAAAVHPGADTVVIAFAWQAYIDLVDAEGRPEKDPKRALIQGLDSTIELLRTSGKNVILLGPLAVPGYDVASVVSRTRAYNRPLDLKLAVKQDSFEQEYGMFLSYYRRKPSIVFLEPHIQQCTDGSCRFIVDDQSVFSDGTHLSKFALPLFDPTFDQIFEKQKNQ